jgi:hypothetical protein
MMSHKSKQELLDTVRPRYRKAGRKEKKGSTKPGTLLKQAIPIRTFADWDDKRPGFFEVNPVAHGGDSAKS